MKLFKSKIGVKAFLATVSSEVLLMRIFVRHSHNMKFQSPNKADLSRTSNNDRNSLIHKKLWRETNGKLPSDPFFPKAAVDTQCSVGVFENLNFQLPSLNLNDLGEDVVVDTHYSSTKISNPRTTGIYDEDPQWRSKHDDIQIEIVQTKMATEISLSTEQQHRMPIDTLFNIKVRDFAFENHGVKSARVVSEVDVLKHRYTKERAAHQTPPVHIIDDLLYFDPDWLSDAQTRADQYFIDILANSI
ncbi:hypothetical protein Clacol_008435 [Clathrus columnatus]|uniref:Uncharacterized protein n=1 Tax=Clathrus columnatus TaxID=1419009 RepID=A0AAV5AHS6_9AGAM|nr:hypothetical protein Clacol_008435 [Clathrus columnatus]